MSRYPIVCCAWRSHGFSTSTNHCRDISYHLPKENLQQPPHTFSSLDSALAFPKLSPRSQHYHGLGVHKACQQHKITYAGGFSRLNLVTPVTNLLSGNNYRAALSCPRKIKFPMSEPLSGAFNSDDRISIWSIPSLGGCGILWARRSRRESKERGHCSYPGVAPRTPIGLSSTIPPGKLSPYACFVRPTGTFTGQKKKNSHIPMQELDNVLFATITISHGAHNPCNFFPFGDFG